jgi:hypothetical protein
MGRVPLPKPSFLDDCEYPGDIYGERRWRGPDGQLYTWDGLHGEIEVYVRRGRHQGVADATSGERVAPARRGRRIVSDVRNESRTFMTLYEQGHVTPEQIDEFVEAWHESGDEEKRSLVEYLGMTEAEYDIEFITPRALPAILAARRAKRPLREFVVPFFEALQTTADPADKPVLRALSFWLERHPAE